MYDADTIELPVWACVSESRRSHIARVTALLARWAEAMSLDVDEARDWEDAGRLHDVLRDAPEHTLRSLAQEHADAPLEILHGPAAATRLQMEGETRRPVLEAVRWHTVGSAEWDRVGRALYMADYLEPGRGFSLADRAFLASRVPQDFDGVLRRVVRLRLERALRNGHGLHDRTVSLWNDVR